jgi:hypothetical protein
MPATGRARCRPAAGARGRRGALDLIRARRAPLGYLGRLLNLSLQQLERQLQFHANLVGHGASLDVGLIPAVGLGDLRLLVAVFGLRRPAPPDGRLSVVYRAP